MIEYRFAAPEHRADLIDFINYVFSQNSVPHDFKTLIPKVYADGRGYDGIHAIVLDDGRVKGVVGQYPVHASFGGAPLEIGYIGSVSTHPYARGSGYMIKMMEMQAEHAKETGIDVMMLGGQRQRYEYYGYSPVGCQYTYQVNAANVRHALRSVDASTVGWKRFADAAEAEIDLAYRLYQQQPITGVRSREDFELIMRTWRAEPYLLLHEAEVLGYMVVSGTDSVSELVVSDVSCVPELIKGWFAANGLTNRRFSVAAFDTALNRVLAAFAEGYQVSNCTQARIVNLANVLRACLTLKMRAGALSDGEVILQMADEAPGLARAKDGQITVQETDAAPNVHLPRLEMQQLLFASNRFAAPDVSCPVDWFPLPLFLYGADHF